MKQIIGFFGGDSQTGTTMIAWSFAERLSEKGEKVLFIMGSGNDDHAILKYEGGHSMDELKPALRSGNVEKEDFLQCLEKKKQLWILPGVKNSLAAEQYLENTFDILLEHVQGEFDYVIIDGGSDVRQGLMISALHACTCRYFVVTQQAKGLYRFLRCRERLLMPLGLNGSLILNKYRKDPALFLKKDICKMTAQEEILTIPYVAEGWQVEMEKKNLLFSAAFSREIDRLTSCFVKGKERRGNGKNISFRKLFAKPDDAS